MHRNATHSNKGFTLAETILVVAIVLILAAVGFIAVSSYQRSTRLLEMDGIAKEIYVAAQNHLSLAESQGLVAQRAANKRGSSSDDVTGVYATDAYPAALLDVRYFVVPAPDAVTDAEKVLSLMLPLAAVDETVRLGGSYIVVYDVNSATVLDVFYSNRSTERFGHDFAATELKTLLTSYRETGRDNRKNYGGAVIGWYGGAEAIGSVDPSKVLDIQDFTIYNDDTLRVVVPDPNPALNYAELRLIMRGKDSGATTTIDLVKREGGVLTYPNGAKDASGNFTVVLDDITVGGKHFTEQFSNFRPGEDIELTLEAYSSTEIVKMPAPIGPKTTNSLFASVTGTTAEVSSFRHLENLDKRVSGLGDDGKALSTPLTGAQQSADLLWSDFFAEDNGQPGGGTILAVGGADLSGGNYFPADLPDNFNYTGNRHSVTGVVASVGGNAGLFGTLTGGTISDLELVDFDIESTAGYAGALAGKITGQNSDAARVTVQNVLVRDSAGGVSAAAAVTGAQGAGGLIGFVNGEGSRVLKSGAAVRVESTAGDAGGLIGLVGGTSVSVAGCYSGGRTDNGVYSSTAYNVTAASGHSGGGLIGDAGSAAITSSYSTCSASGTTAGGLAGKASGTINKCYATGLVSGSTAGAFLGDYAGAVASVTENKYYMIVNETVVGSGVSAEVSYLPAFGHTANTGSYGVSALDADASTYNAFVGPETGWDTAKPYDGVLSPYYQGGYPLRGVERMGAGVTDTDFVSVHYGDWPAPELRVMNVK